jgi:hypothetical protein
MCCHHQILGGNDISFDVLAGNGKDFALGFIEQRAQFVLLIVALVRKPVARHDQPAQDVLFPDDLDVIVGVCRRRNETVKFVQVLGSADFLELVTVFKRLFEGDEVSRFTLLVELEHQFVNDLVCRNVKGVRLQPQDALIGNLARREQERADDAFFAIFTERKAPRRLATRDAVVKSL